MKVEIPPGRVTFAGVYDQHSLYCGEVQASARDVGMCCNRRVTLERRFRVCIHSRSVHLKKFGVVQRSKSAQSLILVLKITKKGLLQVLEEKNTPKTDSITFLIRPGLKIDNISNVTRNTCRMRHEKKTTVTCHREMLLIRSSQHRKVVLKSFETDVRSFIIRGENFRSISRFIGIMRRNSQLWMITVSFRTSSFLLLRNGRK